MGAESRYCRRIHWWKKEVTVLPSTRHRFWWILHNCISHPILGFFPCGLTVLFHDWTSMHLNLKTKINDSPFPVITSYPRWVWHNVVSHIGIGLFPYTIVFTYHDKTAESMNVDNWL